MLEPADPDLQPKFWHRDQWEATFGRELPSKRFDNWPDGVRMMVMLTFDTQGGVDAAVPSYQLTSCTIVSHEGVRFAAMEDVARLCVEPAAAPVSV